MLSKRVQSAKKVIAIGVATLCAGVIANVQAQVSGGATLTSDYVWRGSSQTREDPAIQLGLKYAHESGVYASVWGSNVHYKPDNGASSEFDLAVGWSGEVSEDWALDTYLLRYQYPGANAGINWNEINTSVIWRSNYWLAVGYSDNAMASQTAGTYVTVGAKIPLNEQWRVESAVSHYALDSTYANSYTHASAGVVWGFQQPYEARLTLHGSDLAAKRLFPGMAGSRLELAIQTSF